MATKSDAHGKRNEGPQAAKTGSPVRPIRAANKTGLQVFAEREAARAMTRKTPQVGRRPEAEDEGLRIAREHEEARGRAIKADARFPVEVVQAHRDRLNALADAPIA